MNLRELFSLRNPEDRPDVEGVAHGASDERLASALLLLAEDQRYYPAGQRAAFIREAAERLSRGQR